MLHRYAVTYTYAERVRREPREFVHETIIEAVDDADAYARAVAYFDDLFLQSGVGWRRTLRSIAVAPASKGTVAKGGRRAPRNPEVME